MSLFITFEGGRDRGKAPRQRFFLKDLKAAGQESILTHEPGGTGLGEKITQLLKWGDDEHICPLAEVMLFNASRAELVTRILKPALSEGKIVVCDRFIDSTLVYQGYGRGLNASTVKAVNSIATQGLMPGITFLLDLPVGDGLLRKQGTKADRFEKESIDFHRRVRDGYLALAATEPTRWVVVDASLSKEIIADTIWDRIQKALKSHSHIRP